VLANQQLINTFDIPKQTNQQLIRLTNEWACRNWQIDLVEILSRKWPSLSTHDSYTTMSGPSSKDWNCTLKRARIKDCMKIVQDLLTRSIGRPPAVHPHRAWDGAVVLPTRGWEVWTAARRLAWIQWRDLIMREGFEKNLTFSTTSLLCEGAMFDGASSISSPASC
jgi:hypothetical protein